MICKYYYLWAIISGSRSRGQEINGACLDEENRTIKKCPFRREKQCECPDYKPYEK